jgi:hypothetical protein
MSSLISILALCILVLSNGCFTLPVVNQQIPSSTYTPINDDVTTGETINLRVNFHYSLELNSILL